MLAINLYRAIKRGRYPVVAQLPQVVLVDDTIGVTPDIVNHHWNLDNHGYARRMVKVQGKWVTIFFHHEVMRLMGMEKPGPGYTVDHINRVKLDCQYSNLRWATRSQQQANQKKHVSVHGLPKGVSRTQGGRFQAKIQVNGNDVYLGVFDTVEEAALAFRQKWEQIHPGEVFVE